MADGLKLEDPGYFDRLAAVEAGHWWSLGLWRLVAYWLDDALRGRQRLDALDVGCGAGGTALRLAARPEVGRVVGLDPSADALVRASACHPRPLVRGSALALPFDDNTFDVVTCFDVWQHLPPGGDLVSAREVARVLSPGGAAVLRTNGRGWSGDASTYTTTRLAALLDQAGLNVARLTYANALPALAQEARGALTRRPGHPSGGGLRIDLPPRALNRALRAVSGLEAYVAGRLRRPLPFGHSTLALATAPPRGWP